MKKSCVKTIALFLTVAIASTVLISCGEEGVTTAGGSVDLEKLANSSYPIETDATLKWWSYRGGTAYGDYVSADEMPSIANYEKATGVDIEWEYVMSGQEKQQFNLMMASGELPDIISYYWTYNDIPAGPDKAIADGFLTSLNEYIPKYAPGLNKYLEENPGVARDLKSDGGQYYYMPSYSSFEAEAKNLLSSGWMFRKDWLDELGLPVPETIDDWYTTLKAFKEMKNASAPLSVSYQQFNRGLSGAFGVALGLYKDGNTVKFGYAEPGYKDFLTTMNKWYNEGLLDKSVASIDQKSVDAKMLNGSAGATFGWMSTGFEKLTGAARENEPTYTLVGVPYPTLKKGEKNQFVLRDPVTYFAGAAITQACKNKELAVKLLDFGFTPEGREVLRYGIEGETYEIEDGNYKYTDLIERNPDGLTRSEALSVFVRNTENIPALTGTVGLRAKEKSVYKYLEAEQALANWRDNEGDKTRLPSTLAPAFEDSSEYAQIMTDLNAYCPEMMLKFIIGEEPLTKYDEYIAELEQRGLSRALEIMQASYDRYMSR